MTAPADVRGGMPTRISEAFKLESQPAPCPGCGGESIAIRYAPPAYLSATLKARLNPERPFVPKLCNSCIATSDHAAELERQRQQRDMVMATINVPPEYATTSLDTFSVAHAAGADHEKLERALTFGRDYVTNWPDVPMISVFAGGFGAGKGHLSWAIVRELALQHGVTSRVVVLGDVIRDLREAWNSAEDGPSEAKRLRQYRSYELLTIDELSRHAFYGQPQQHLYDLVAYREIWHRPTILTTNERGCDLAGVLGPALSSRAIGCRGFVDFGDTDYRVERARTGRAPDA